MIMFYRSFLLLCVLLSTAVFALDPYKTVLIRDTALVNQSFMIADYNLGRLLAEVAQYELLGSDSDFRRISNNYEIGNVSIDNEFKKNCYKGKEVQITRVSINDKIKVKATTTVGEGNCPISEVWKENLTFNDDGVTINYSLGAYVKRIFDMGSKDQIDFASYHSTNPNNPESQWPTINNSNNRLSRVTDEWQILNGVADLRTINSVSGLSIGPFRLLAVANRMDLAGDFDDRMTTLASRTPRYLGEIHLIFGLVDVGSGASLAEKVQNGTKLNTTFSISYRLPLVDLNSNDKVLPYSGSSDFTAMNTDTALHKTQLQNWAKAWKKLDSFDIDTENYRNKIKAILSESLKAENFIGFRSNTKFNSGNDFELREWYVFESAVARERNGNGNLTSNYGQLIPRKPRREPYTCLDNSTALGDLITAYWQGNDGTGDTEFDHPIIIPAYDKKLYGDLDRHTRTVNNDPNGNWDEYRAGFAILREKDRDFFREENIFGDGWVGDYDEINPFKSIYLNRFTHTVSGHKNFYWVNSSCNQYYKDFPYAMITAPTGRNTPFDPDNRGGRNYNEYARDAQLMMLAPFGRLAKLTNGEYGIRGPGANKAYWEVTGVSNVKRHAFATRTCTGCHSYEGGAKGFHIFPRDNASEASLSPSLVGMSNSITINGTGYKYNILQDRTDFIDEILDTTFDISDFRSKYRNLKPFTNHH